MTPVAPPCQVTRQKSQPGEGDVAEPSREAPRRGDLPPRELCAYREAGQHRAAPDTWFDISRVVRLLRTNCHGSIRLSLRKLYVRWWCALHHTMRKLLERCGVPEETPRLLPEICQTCKICCEWARPGPSNASNVKRADTWNALVERGLLFSKSTLSSA